MADEEKNEATSEEEESPKKSKKMLFIIVGVVVLLAVGGGGFFGYKTLMAKEDVTEEPEEKKEVKELPEMGEIVAIPLAPQPFNLKDPKRYINFQIELMLPKEPASVKEQIEARRSQIMDMLISMLSEKTTADLMADGGLDQFKQEIKSRLATYYDESYIEDVFVTKFLIQ